MPSFLLSPGFLTEPAGVSFYVWSDRVLPGTRLKGRYQLVRKLGKGGEGETFIAWDQERQRKVVVKFQLARVTESTGTYTDFGQDITNEYGHLRSMLDMPGIPDVFDIGTHGSNSRKFLVMELVNGETLDSWIRNHHPVPKDAAISVIAQLCVILGALHAKNYVHRDVTPKNTMLQPNGQIRLLDVGIAVKCGSVNEDPRGTEWHAAPEQFTKGAYMTPQVDVFSLGVLLFEMIASELPYSTLEYPIKVTSTPFSGSFFGDIPEPLLKLGISMVAADPSERPNGVAEVLRSLRPMLPKPGSPASPKATRPDPTTPFRYPIPRL